MKRKTWRTRKDQNKKANKSQCNVYSYMTNKTLSWFFQWNHLIWGRGEAHADSRTFEVGIPWTYNTWLHTILQAFSLGKRRSYFNAKSYNIKGQGRGKSWNKKLKCCQAEWFSKYLVTFLRSHLLPLIITWVLWVLGAGQCCALLRMPQAELSHFHLCTETQNSKHLRLLLHPARRRV